MLILALLTAAFIALTLSLHFTRYPPWTAPGTGTLSLIFLLLSIVWVISDQFTDEGFNSAVFYHLRVGFQGGGSLEYIELILATLSLIAVALAASAWIAWSLHKKRPRETGPPAYPVLLALLLLCVVHPTSNAFLAISNNALYGNDSVSSALLSDRELEDTSQLAFAAYYSDPSTLEPGVPRKNLVVIYAESLEQTYFDDTLFPGLITKLRKFENRAIRFTDVTQVRSAGFTIGGIVAGQCGIPLITSGHPNSMRGMAEFLPGATCIGDVLKAEGYALHYLGGAQLSFAGKGTFFSTHGFTSIEGLETLEAQLEDPGYVSNWGLYDDTLLDHVYARFESLASAGDPFALFGLTMDTHHPHGHQSRSCEALPYGDGSNRMLNAVKCADHLLAALIGKILESPWAESTVLVLASDHLAMKNDALDKLRQGRRRNLLWIFPPGETAPREVATPSTTLDSAAIIMHQIGSSNAHFGLGRNTLDGTVSLRESVPRLDWQLGEWRRDLGAFWQLPTGIETLEIDPQEMRFEIHGKNYKAPALLTLVNGTVEALRFEFDSIVKLPSYVRQAKDEELLIWIDSCQRVRAMALALPRDGLCVFAGKLGSWPAEASVLNGRYKLTAKELKRLERLPIDTEALSYRRDNLTSLEQYGDAALRRFDAQADLPEKLAFVEIRSSSGPGTESYIDIGSQRQKLARGLNVLQITSQGIELVTRYDSCDAPLASTAKLSRELARSQNAASVLAVVVHDSATCGQKLGALFAGSPLNRGKELRLRQPYVAVFSASDQGKPVLEVLGESGSSMLVRLK